MPRTIIWTRAFILGLAAIALIGVASKMPSSTVDAAQCPGGGYSDAHEAWESTSAAISRTLAGDCPAGYACKEWCVTACGTTQGQGVFSCFVQ